MELRQRLLYPFAKRFFAGFSLEDAIKRSRDVNSRRMGAIIDFLGEDVSEPGEAEKAKAEYNRVITETAKAKLDASFTIKLTNLGLSLSKGITEKNAFELAKAAKDAGVFLWVDMESSRHTSDTIDIYKKILRTNPECGIALQASLKRTKEDLDNLISECAVIRLVKGAYREPPDLAFQKASEVRSAWLGLAQELFNKSGRFAIGTHDKLLVGEALRLAGGYRGRFEFQMLMGVRDALKEELIDKGRRVVEYIPYGTDWYGYGVRRLMEKKRNIVYMAQSLAGR